MFIGELKQDIRILTGVGKKTREEVSKETGIGITSLAMYESGERNPRDEVKLTLANYYGKTVSDIFFV